MKSQRNKRQRPSPGKPTSASKIQSPVKAPVSGAKLWGFRLLALMAPLLLLGLIESGLRLAGCGYPTSFFLKSREGNVPMLKDNPKFGWRFFPPQVARAPRPLFFAARKPPQTVRIFVLGGSAAMGDPDPSYGFARQLGRILQARHPDQHVEVINAAMTAINSPVVREIARDCRPYQGDFWLVFAGNNEVLGPFGAGTVFGHQALGLTAVRLTLAVKSTRIGELLARWIQNSGQPTSWKGLELFLGQQVASGDPRLKSVYSNFAANLKDIINMGRESGAKIMLATVPVNLKDCPPFASVHRSGLSQDERADWEKLFSAGTKAQDERRFEDALADYGKAAQIDGEFAQLIFQRAECELELKKTALAQTDFRLARDLDSLRFRTDSRLNEIIRQVASVEHVTLLHADRQFSRSPEVVPGEDLFYDHVHLNFQGNYRLAVLFAEKLESQWPGPPAPDSPWLTEAEVARRLAFTEFDQRRIDIEMRERLRQPPFTLQSNFRLRDEHWRETIAHFSAPASTFATNYEAAIALAPEDWVLHANFARLLEAAGDNAGATEQWLDVARLLPHSPEPWANLGHLARLAGDSERAAGFLKEALRQNPDSVPALTEFGLVEAGSRATQDALRQFRAALRLQPDFSAARISLALLLSREGDAAGALTQYREELRWHTNNVEARIDLANLLNRQGQAGEAAALFEKAIALQPENPIARYDFGRLLSANDRPADAVTQFEAALQQRPDLAEIHYELGNALARLGKDADALVQFAEAVHLRPDLVNAHFNLGVALAKRGRFTEAVAQFRETLRLNPHYPNAQRMLDAASSAAHQNPRVPHK